MRIPACIATLLTVALTLLGCQQETETCACCDGTTVEIEVCDDCTYAVPPCEGACGGRGAEPECRGRSDAGAADATLGVDAGRPPWTSCASPFRAGDACEGDWSCAPGAECCLPSYRCQAGVVEEQASVLTCPMGGDSCAGLREACASTPSDPSGLPLCCPGFLCVGAANDTHCIPEGCG